MTKEEFIKLYQNASDDIKAVIAQILKERQ
jgi:hypothetical protein